MVQACILRVARLYPSGVPQVGSQGVYVSDSLVQLVVTPEIIAGDEFELKNACGAICVNFRGRDRVKRLGLTLGLCKRDPQLMEILSGGVTLSPDGIAVGYGQPKLNTENTQDISLELWSKRITASGDLDATYPYERFALPRVTLQIGPTTFANGPIIADYVGFATENPNWEDGPLDDWPVASDRALQSIPTNSIPTAQCGYQNLPQT